VGVDPILWNCVGSRSYGWVKIHSNKDTMTPRIGWTSNLQILGSIETNTIEKAVSWNIGSHGYKGSSGIPMMRWAGKPVRWFIETPRAAVRCSMLQ